MEENDRNRNEPDEPDSAEGSDEFGLDPAQELATNLDPNLQDVILSLKSGKSPDPSLIQESQEGDLTIEVLAVLRDPQKPVEGLNDQNHDICLLARAGSLKNEARRADSGPARHPVLAAIITRA